MVGLVVVAWLYSQGVKTLWWRSGVGQGITPWEALAFNGGLTVIFIAFISPLSVLSEDLFAAHMVQHLLLLLVAAPLFVLGRAFLALAWSIPRSVQRWLGYWWRQQSDLHLIGRLLLQPRMSWGVHLVILWVWQAPYVYKVALHDPIVHIAQHGVFLGAAILFWRLLLLPDANNPLPCALKVRFLTSTALTGVLLGVLIMFAPTLWHPIYAPTAAHWGLTALADQRLAGMILAVAVGIIYLGIITMFWRSWRRGDQTTAASPHPVHLANSAVR